jgi:hypothetical protein
MRRPAGPLRLQATGYALGFCGAGGVVLHLHAVALALQSALSDGTAQSPAQTLAQTVGSLLVAAVFVAWAAGYTVFFAVSVAACRARLNILRPEDSLACGPLSMALPLLASMVFVVGNGLLEAAAGASNRSTGGEEAALTDDGSVVAAFRTACLCAVLLGFLLQLANMCVFVGHVYHQLHKPVCGRRTRSGNSRAGDEDVDEAASAAGMNEAVRLPEPTWFPCTVGVCILCLTAPQVGLGCAADAGDDAAWVGFGQGLLTATMYAGVAWTTVLLPVSGLCRCLRVCIRWIGRSVPLRGWSQAWFSVREWRDNDASTPHPLLQYQPPQQHNDAPLPCGCTQVVTWRLLVGCCHTANPPPAEPTATAESFADSASVPLTLPPTTRPGELPRHHHELSPPAVVANNPSLFVLSAPAALIACAWQTIDLPDGCPNTSSDASSSDDTVVWALTGAVRLNGVVQLGPDWVAEALVGLSLLMFLLTLALMCCVKRRQAAMGAALAVACVCSRHRAERGHSSSGSGCSGGSSTLQESTFTHGDSADSVCASQEAADDLFASQTSLPEVAAALSAATQRSASARFWWSKLRAADSFAV